MKEEEIMKKFCKSCIAVLLSMVFLFGVLQVAVSAFAVAPPFGGGATISVRAVNKVMNIGETQVLSVTTSPEGISLVWSSSNTSVATVDSYGKVTAKGEGTVTITAANYEVNATTSTGSVVLTVVDGTATLGIRNGSEYYIMNYFGSLFLAPENDSDVTGTNVRVVSRSDATTSQWRAFKLSNGKYKFQNVHSPTGKCLDVTQGNVDLYTNGSASYLQFTLERIPSGNYAGLYIIKYGDGYVAQGTDGNVEVVSTLTYRCYWSFMDSNRRFADLFSLSYPLEGSTFQTTTNNNTFTETIISKGYAGFSHINGTSSTAYNYLRNRDDIFIGIGHGDAGLLGFYDGSGNVTGVIAADYQVTAFRAGLGTDKNYISNLNYNELNHVRAALYLGCKTGVDYTKAGNTYNLVNDTFAKGAHFALGVTEIVFNTQLNEWLKHFIDAVKIDEDIGYCIYYANSKVGTINIPVYDSDGNQIGTKSNYGLPITYVGDTTQCLNLY